MAPSISILLASIVIPYATAQNCNCFLTNGSTPSYFTTHSFQDYRNVPHALTAAPAALSSEQETTNAPVSSSYFNSDSWTNMWNIQTWNTSDSITAVSNDAKLLMVNSQNNVYIENAANPTPNYTTHLTLRTTRLSTFQSVAEIDTVAQNYQYISLRVLARVIGSPGACAGIFTYRSPQTNTQSGPSSSSNVQEADIEILTSGPRNRVQYTNQPAIDSSGNGIDAATANVTMPHRADWSSWNVYRLDWTPGKSEWYINGERQAAITFQAPRDPAGLILNLWSDAGAWSGNMSQHDYAYLQVQWIDLVYNTSGPAAGSKRDIVSRADSKGCQVVCSVDAGQGASAGSPVVVANNTAGAPGLRAQGSGSAVGLLGGLLVAVVGVLFL